MSIRAHCACGKTYLFKEKAAGRRVKCPSCGGPLQVPGGKDAADNRPRSDDDSEMPPWMLKAGLGATAGIVVIGFAVAAYLAFRNTDSDVYPSLPERPVSTHAEGTAPSSGGGTPGEESKGLLSSLVQKAKETLKGEPETAPEATEPPAAPPAAVDLPWKIASASGWSAPLISREVPTTKGFPLTLYAGHLSDEDKGKAAAGIEIRFEANKIQPDAVQAWKARLAKAVPSRFLGEVTGNNYRLFDSEEVLLVLPSGEKQPPKFVWNLADRTIVRFGDDNVFMLGESSVPLGGFANSFGTKAGLEFVSLVAKGKPCEIILVYHVPESITLSDCRIEFCGQSQPIVPQPSGRKTFPVAVTWHMEGW